MTISSVDEVWSDQRYDYDGTLRSAEAHRGYCKLGAICTHAWRFIQATMMSHVGHSDSIHDELKCSTRREPSHDNTSDSSRVCLGTPGADTRPCYAYAGAMENEDLYRLRKKILPEPITTARIES